MPVHAPVSQRLQRWLFGSLMLWAVGAQISEGLVTAGMALTILGAIALVWPQRSWDRAKVRLREWWPLLAFMGWALLVPPLAGKLPKSVGVARIGDWAALPAAVVAFSAMNARQRRWLAWTIGGVFVVSCLVAGLQYRGWWPAREAFAPLRWTRIPFDRVYEKIPSMHNRFPGGGLLFHRLKFANVGGLIVVGAVAYGWEHRGALRWGAWLIAALGVVSIVVFAFARAAGGAVLGAVFVMLLVSRLRWTRTLAAVAVISLVMGTTVMVLPRIRSRFSHVLDTGSNGDRKEIWAAGLRAVKSSPVFGIGLWQFRPGKFPDATMPAFLLKHPGEAHDQFLSFAAQIGIPGALLFMWLLIWLALRMKGPGAMAGYGALAFFATVSLFHDPLFHAPVSMATVLALGILLVIAREARERESAGAVPKMSEAA